MTFASLVCQPALWLWEKAGILCTTSGHDAVSTISYCCSSQTQIDLYVLKYQGKSIPFYRTIDFYRTIVGENLFQL